MFQILLSAEERLDSLSGIAVRGKQGCRFGLYRAVFKKFIYIAVDIFLAVLLVQLLQARYVFSDREGLICPVSFW